MARLERRLRKLEARLAWPSSWPWCLFNSSACSSERRISEFGAQRQRDVDLRQTRQRSCAAAWGRRSMPLNRPETLSFVSADPLRFVQIMPTLGGDVCDEDFGVGGLHVGHVMPRKHFVVPEV